MGYNALMFDEVLDIEAVKRFRSAQGCSITWLSQQVGMKRHPGFVMFRIGLLPKDPCKRAEVLKRLSEVTGLNRDQLVLPPLLGRGQSA
jgi:hypothetical protein